MEQLDYNLLYRWFVGLSPDDPIWDPTTFTKNRDRPADRRGISAKFMSNPSNHPEVSLPLLSDEHFSVDGTLIEARASHKSFRPKDGSDDDDGGADFHGQQRKNDTQREHQRSRQPTLPQGRRAEAKFSLHGPRHHGELPWAGGGGYGLRLADGTCRAPRFADHAQGCASEAGGRITVGEDGGLRHGRPCGLSARHQRYAACDAERLHHRNRQASSERHRRTAPRGTKAMACRNRVER